MKNLYAEVHKYEIYVVEPTTANGAIDHEMKTDHGRTACVISNDKGNRYSTNVSVAYTRGSDTRSDLPVHVNYVDPNGLFSGAICAEDIQTVSKQRLGTFLCKLDEKGMRQLDKALAVQFGFEHLFKEFDELQNPTRTKKTLESAKLRFYEDEPEIMVPIESTPDPAPELPAEEPKEVEHSVIYDSAVDMEEYHRMEGEVRTYRKIYEDLQKTLIKELKSISKKGGKE